MTVLDSSVVVDYLVRQGAALAVDDLLDEPTPAAAPDVLVFEILAVLRRDVARREMSERRALTALDDLGDLGVELFPSLQLWRRAFALRHNMTMADALFVALAEALGEPLATKDRGLARAAVEHAAAEVVLLG